MERKEEAIPEILQNSYNKQTLETYLAGSCHSDPAEAVQNALHELADVDRFYMATWGYPSIFWSYRQCIFAYGEGMLYIRVRLLDETAQKYMSKASLEPDKCPQWYRMEPPWGNDAFKEVLLAAYSEAVSASEKLSQ